MTEFYYGVQVIAKRAARSPSTGQQWMRHLPAPEAVLVSKRPAGGWTLDTWQKFADTRRPDLQKDLSTAIEELRNEEVALYREFR